MAVVQPRSGWLEGRWDFRGAPVCNNTVAVGEIGRQFSGRMVNNQSTIGILARMGAFARGLLVSVVTGFFWGIFTFATQIRMDWLPVLTVGLFVGRAVRGAAEKRSWRFGVLGALLTLPGCLLGELFSEWGCVVGQMGGLPHQLFHPDALAAIYLGQWRWSD